MNMNYGLGRGPIVVGTDVSPASKLVVEYAVALAIAESKPLYLVYVMPMVPDESLTLMEIQRDELENQVKATAKIMGRVGLVVEGVFSMGGAAHELIRIGTKLDAAYLIVGTEGLRGLDRLLMGSAAETTIRRADRPVIVIGPEATKRAKKTIPWKHLMLACDTAHGVTRAASLAGNIAVEHHARLTIFNVRQEGLENVPEGQFDGMEKMMSREAWLTIQPQCLMRAGEPAKEITRMIDDTQADLLIMSVRSGGELLTHLRSGIIAKILRMSRCPAMVLRDFPSASHGRQAQSLDTHQIATA